MGKLLNHRYELIRPIGEGGCGLVCHARDTLNDEDVAIKIYKDSVPFPVFTTRITSWDLFRDLKTRSSLSSLTWDTRISLKSGYAVFVRMHIPKDRFISTFTLKGTRNNETNN